MQDISALRADGYSAWLDKEMNQPLDQSGKKYLASNGFEVVDNNYYFIFSRLTDYMIWSQLLSGQNSVRKRAALALSEFFVVSAEGIADRWKGSTMACYWDILKRNAFGNFRDLLEEITLCTAMGDYLDMIGSEKADPKTGRVPDENYGREIMQLFTIGLHELNIDGTVRTDKAGKPIETYTNDDIIGIAKVFTGYQPDYSGDIVFRTPPGKPNTRVADTRVVYRQLTADGSKHRYHKTNKHSPEEKKFLKTTIPAGTSARQSLKITLDALFNHPNVGPFFGKQMIQRLVTSNPSRAYVKRVAEVFNNNGAGQRGDLRAVFKAILTDEEALSQESLNSQTFGKLREPMLRFAQWARTFNVQSKSGRWQVPSLVSSNIQLGQSPLRSPSVFNFFRPGYVPVNSKAAENNLVAPEFQLVNEIHTAIYVNFMEQTIAGFGGWVSDLKVSYSEEVKIAHNAEALLNRIDLLLTGNQLSTFARNKILTALKDTNITPKSSETAKRRQVQRAIMLTMVSNDYLIQK